MANANEGETQVDEVNEVECDVDILSNSLHNLSLEGKVLLNLLFCAFLMYNIFFDGVFMAFNRSFKLYGSRIWI